MFNLLVTTHRNMETEASSEMHALLAELGDEGSEIDYTNVSGLLTARTNLEPLEVVQKIRKMVLDEPWKLRYVLRLIPIEVVVNTDLDSIKDTALKLASRIKDNETFRVTVEKRRSDIPSTDIIEAVASVIDREVSLKEQDWIVLVEIIGKETGISVIKPDSIFSAVKVKRESP